MNQTPTSQSPTYESTGANSPAARLAKALNELRGSPYSGQMLAYGPYGPGPGIYGPNDRPPCLLARIPWANQPAVTLEQAQALIDLAREGEETNR